MKFTIFCHPASISYLIPVGERGTLLRSVCISIVWNGLVYSDKRSNPHKRIIWSCAWSHDAKVSAHQHIIVTHSTFCCIGSSVVYPERFIDYSVSSYVILEFRI